MIARVRGSHAQRDSRACALSRTRFACRHVNEPMPIAADRAGATDARNVELELVSHIPRALGWIPTSFGVDAREEKIKVRRGRLGGG
jgi:hypothetical protein